MDGLLYIGIVYVMIILPVFLVVMDIINYTKKKARPVFELIAFITGGVYMALAYWVWDLPGYEQALNIYGFENVHEPFSSRHLLTLLMFALAGFVCYFIRKFVKKKLPPLAEVFLLGGMYAGAAVCAAVIVQLALGAKPQGLSMSEYDWMSALSLCSVPFIFIVHVTELMVRLVKEKAKEQEEREYKNPVLRGINRIFLKGANIFYAALFVMLPVMALLIMILCLFGQQPDSIIKAFTETSDWALSQETAPPPVEYDVHYLCTVSLRGHKGLVRPIRYGIRRGRRIVVNRQLCIANAFEQLIMERTPTLHRKIRSFYDTYGYPVSKHIRSAWAADVVYVIMKPLEWFFLIILYLFDEKPENRIASQYLPVKIKIM